MRSSPAATEAQDNLDWFDSIHGDRENGRVHVRYAVLDELVTAFREPLPTVSDDLRFAVAELLDEAHGPCVDEGGCSFRAEHIPWCPHHDRPHELDPVVDELIAKVIEVAKTRIREAIDTSPTDHIVTVAAADELTNHIFAALDA